MYENWQCPYCGCFSTYIPDTSSFSSVWQHVLPKGDQGHEPGDLSAVGMDVQARRCANPNCGKTSYFSQLFEDYFMPVSPDVDFERRYQSWEQIHPRSELAQFNLPDCVPKAIRDDFAEAVLVKGISPKSSVALCRRCVQAMIRDFWGITRRTLDLEIKELDLGGKAPSSIEALDAIREMGNFGAHPERDAGIIIDVEPEDAELSIQIVDTLIKDWYVHKHDFEERQSKLRESIERKKLQRA